MGSIRLSNRRVGLRPLRPDDYSFVQAVELRSERLDLYRHRAITPSPEGFAQRLWQGVLTQFIVEDVASRRPLGIVAAFAADHRNRNAQLAIAALDDRSVDVGRFLEGVELFVDYLFLCFDLRKLIGFVLEPNFDAFRRLVGPVLSLEGTMKGQEFVRGEYVDLRIVAVHRDTWRQRPTVLAVRRRAEPDVLLDAVGFARELESLLGIRMPSVDEATSATLRGDLGIDSLGFLQILDLIEGPCPGELTEDALAAIVTVGDAFHFYRAVHERLEGC